MLVDNCSWFPQEKKLVHALRTTEVRLMSIDENCCPVPTLGFRTLEIKCFGFKDFSEGLREGVREGAREWGRGGRDWGIEGGIVCVFVFLFILFLCPSGHYHLSSSRAHRSPHWHYEGLAAQDMVDEGCRQPTHGIQSHINDVARNN